ncbi:MAG: HAMP domain-containing protein [Spirosomataceae bacterium]
MEVANTKDEIGQLAERFNRMLDRLEDAFQLQRSFVFTLLTNFAHL